MNAYMPIKSERFLYHTRKEVEALKEAWEEPSLRRFWINRTVG